MREGGDGAPSGDAANFLEEILERDLLRAFFQPIVDLERGVTVGFEALARGPEGSNLERPDHLFAAARAGERLADLDRACRRAALDGARRRNLRPPLTLFVNIEPEAVGPDGDGRGIEVAGLAQDGIRVVGEITERALTSRPAELLQAVEGARARGWGIALDDVGADVRSLALMPLIRPDVVKLELRLVQDQPDVEIAAIAGAVGAEAERTGAAVLAEGIETDAHVEQARALGATLGQGFFFGRPAERPSSSRFTEEELPGVIGSRLPAARTPFELASSRRRVRRGKASLLLAISTELELQAKRRRATSFVIASFQEERRFTPRIRVLYEELADELAFVAALGAGLPPEPAPGVRGATIAAGDPLRDTWNVVVVGAHFGAMLAARELPEVAADGQRTFDFVFTYDRDLVVECARTLMLRITPAIS